jgi:hypothetical protein
MTEPHAGASWLAQPRGQKVLLAVAVFALACVPFLPALKGEPILDDNQFLFHHPVVGGEVAWTGAFTRSFFGDLPGGDANPYWRPLVVLLLRIEHVLFGASVVACHVTNLVLHGLNAALVFLLASRWCADARRGVLAALVFAWHPAATESVMWISARSDGLALAFCLLASLAWPRSAAGFSVLWLVALLCKETAAVLPVALLALQRPRWPRWQWLLPLAALATYGFLRLALYPTITASFALATPERIRWALPVLGLHLRVLAVPYPLVFQRHVPVDGSVFVLEWLPGLALVAGAVFLLVRRGVHRGAVAWVLLFVIPTSGLFPVLLFEPSAWPFADRFVYLALVGFAVLIARVPLPLRALAPLPILLACLAAWNGLRFRSAEDLLGHALHHSPLSAGLWKTRGEDRLDRCLRMSDPQASAAVARGAVADLDHALQLAPGWHLVRRSLAMACACAGDVARGEALARDLAHERPSDPVPPFYLAQILHAQGRDPEARSWLHEALDRDATFPWAKAHLEALDRRR